MLTFHAVFLTDVDSWQDLLMLWVQRFPVSVCGGGPRSSRYRVADRPRYSSTFVVHNRIMWLRFERKPFDEKEKRGVNVWWPGPGVYGIPLASLPLPFVRLEEIRSLLQASQRRPQTIIFSRSLHPRNLHCDSLGCHRISNRSYPEGPRGEKDHDEFVPVARALDHQLYF